ncbi:MAG: UDP-N-acetylmuramate--L-alanine ligase [Candidatus Omnitrophica bacterium]|nr:UDP-N-acetylmuramate--L-alanine ligase [Candidatus Omnitrophota bacterium]
MKNKKYHFIGIGGAGMSGLAQILLESGKEVEGSDLKGSDLTGKLKALGAGIFIGHRKENISRDTDVVIYSSAIPPDNPEIVEAKERHLVILKRAELLAELMNSKKGIAISGSHGKTTTTSMITMLLSMAGLSPTFVIGGEVSDFGGNAGLGKGEYFVAESDESDGSFLLLPHIFAVITNIDREHMDYYGSMKEVEYAYLKFAMNNGRGGALFACTDDGGVRKLLENYPGESITYGIDSNAELTAKDIQMDHWKSEYTCCRNGKKLGKISLQVPGIHNVCNSLAAIGVGLKLNIDFSAVAGALADYHGAQRRFQLKGIVDDIMIIDDYAHHPAEIRATLSACKNWKERRILGVFQPHRYTRTKDLADQFGRSFSGTDYLVLTDIYSADEQVIPGVSGRNIYDEVKRQTSLNVSYLPRKDITSHLLEVVKPGDMVVILGAGDIGNVGEELVKHLKERK